MIKKIISDFRNSSSFKQMDEPALFRHLATSITKFSASTFIDETHGVKCNVNFDCVTGKNERCEIADLLIISVGPDDSLRATFWQAKKEHSSNWGAAIGVACQFDFTGQFNQWDLLARRPTVSGVSRFQPPADILSAFGSASIGSIGVFYEKAGDIEVYHSIAEMIACPRRAAEGKKKVRLVMNSYLEKYLYMDGEAIVKPTLEEFLEAMFSHRIGALLNSGVSSHRWLAQYTKRKLAAMSSGSRAIGAISRFLGGDELPSDFAISPEDGLNILVIGPLNDGI